ncbi:MAG: glutamate synthase-related protein, partial [Anaerolineae bacterium]|nr:glutamate synthase-related protein [Anaerolineae bacterium]
TVAVVTNPAIDREREQEHFLTEIVVGPRPDLTPSDTARGGCLVIDLPIVPGGDCGDLLLPPDIYRDVAAHHGTMLLEDLLGVFEERQVRHLALVTRPDESTQEAVARLADESLQAVALDTKVLVLDDESAFTHDKGWVDPHLAVARIDKALRCTPRSSSDPVSQRRNVGIVVRSAAIRNLHDLILLLGVGADAVAPYLLLETAVNPSETESIEIRAQRLGRTLRALGVGLQKVTSTMGIHELRGYGRIFSSIGLSASLAETMEMVNYAGGTSRGLTWADIDEDVETRFQEANDGNDKLPREKHFYPAAGKHLRCIAQRQMNPEDCFEEIRLLEQLQPVAVRHIIGFREEHSKSSWSSQIQPFEVDTEITGHSLPFVIASMSFGSQSEQAYRAYAEAAHQLNIIALNGEGGEIDDIMGKYPHNRGQQIASGRFGVNIDLLNASNLLEIKVGQGAKPGEGGHLPGRKVSSMVARARHVSTGIDLISPSNNHDIYSIEDLAQFIEELKTANPKARVAVKVPVVPGIGVISVGIAKAGADIINLTGYDGGTGAARAHSIKHVGLPAEIGLIEAQRELVSSGMRHRVELWADGGVRTPDDIVKFMCLGANRVGFGTVAMVALGCVLCRRCHHGDCPRGIAGGSLASTKDRAQIIDFEQGVKDLVTLFTELGREVKAVAARLGFDRLQDLVGRSNLLEQVSNFDRLDMDELLVPATNAITYAVQSTGIVPLRRPRNHLTTVISNVVMEAMARGEERIIFEDGHITPVDRALGTHLAGALTRYRQAWDWHPGHNGVGGEAESWRRPLSTSSVQIPSRSNLDNVTLRFYASSVPGNGLGAFSCGTIDITVEGGAQDGVGKGLSGGRVVVLKGYNHDGIRIDGSVGKGLGYGATGGQIIVQGNADSRACIRLSGADVIIGGEILNPLNDSLGKIGARANVKGFLCEYMTAGRVLVLGDPGPWICAGMTGGILYLRLQPELNFDWAAIQRRLARGARVEVRPLGSDDQNNLEDLINPYANELHRGNQQKGANALRDLLEDWETSFVKVVPRP